MNIKRRANLLKVSFAIVAACSSAAGNAQDSRGYPGAAIKFLNVELPLMDAAVAAKDRAYFSGSNKRLQAFLDEWGLKSNPVAIEAFPACTDALTDFQIVGLCRILPPRYDLRTDDVHSQIRKEPCPMSFRRKSKVDAAAGRPEDGQASFLTSVRFKAT